MKTTVSERADEKKARPIHPQVRIGHVHLKVADLERAIAFYRDVLGFELTQRYGHQAAFLSAGGKKSGLVPIPLRELKAEHVPVKRDRALQISHFQMDMADAHLRMYWPRFLFISSL